jgi:hypothetical protein
MCFSAEASFGAAVVLTTVGVIAIKKTEKKDLQFLAVIPVLFGVQQFLEGFVWLSATYESLSGFLKFSTYAFIFFAWMIWPIYIPFTIWKLEKQTIRKKILLVFVLIGLLEISIFAYVMLRYGIHAEVQELCINYRIGIESESAWIIALVYLILTTFSHFISSSRKIWILGIVNIIAYCITKIYFQDHVISVWCFFAAISSLIILWIITSTRTDANKRIAL